MNVGIGKRGREVSFLGIHKSDLFLHCMDISFKDDVTAVLLLGVSFILVLTYGMRP
jgi:hypothetical protein